MKNLIIICVLSLFSFSNIFSQNIKRDTGIINGAAYEILIPSNWNKKLVMYAHGYEVTVTPAGKLQPVQPEFLNVFLNRGFAVAHSGYKRTGWALPEGVDATEELRAFFKKKYGNPDSTFITGHSMGGGITIATIEKFPKNYAGGLALCPIATNPYVLTKAAFDNLLVFNVLFPGVYPKMSDVVSGKAAPLYEGSWEEMKAKSKEIYGKINNNPDLLAAFAKRVDIKPQDIPFSVLFSDGIIRDLVKQSGGNPYDNTNTLYSGYPDDWDINNKVERLAATAPATRLTIYDKTGIVDKPLLMMHTTYDQLIPPTITTHYDNLVHLTHHEKNLKLFLTNGQGHCNFTNEQTATAFDALRAWSKTGQKPTQFEIASPPNPRPVDTLCYELRIYTAAKGRLNDLEKRFRNYTCNFFETCGMKNLGYWTPIDNPGEKLYYILSYPTRAARDLAWKKFGEDTARQAYFKASEANGKLVDKVESIFLKTTDFSPNSFEETSKRVWELRIYTASAGNLDNLLSRFRDHTVDLFEKYGIHNKIYFTATDANQGSDKMLYYFVTHKSEAAGKESFKNFGGSDEWKTVKSASEVKGGGPLTTKIESIYMYPTDFSAIK